MTLRLKGQETQVRMLRNGSPTESTNAVSSFEMTDELEVLEENYLGRTATDYDDIYNGTTFTMDLHIENSAPFDLREQVISRAQRRGADAAARFDIVFVNGLPDGVTKTMTLIDVKFGSIGTSNSARGDFVTMSFEGSCSQVQTIDL